MSVEGSRCEAAFFCKKMLPIVFRLLFFIIFAEHL